MSKLFYEAMGPEKSKLAFKEGDGTHHNSYGSYELAKCIVEGMQANQLPLARILDEQVPFDAAHPDSADSFRITPSPVSSSDKPEGI